MARSATIVSLFAFLLVQSCSGESGDSCRREADCSPSLVCCVAGTATTAGQRGVCQSGCTSVTIDAGATDSGTDSGQDAATTQDAAVDSGTDAGSDAEVDAGP